MKMWMSLAVGIGLTLSVPAVAATGMTSVQQRVAAANTMTALDLAGVMGRSIDTARTTAVASSSDASIIEARVTEALEGDIISSAAPAILVQEALRLTLAAQSCTLVDRQLGTWNRSGCAAIDELLTTVTTALGGPAAAGPTGGIAGAGNGAPPASASGSDYAPD